MNSLGLHMVKRAVAVLLYVFCHKFYSQLKNFPSESYVDDISVFSDLWQSHLAHIEKFLQVIKDSGFVLNLKDVFGSKSSEISGPHNWIWAA